MNVLFISVWLHQYAQLEFDDFSILNFFSAFNSSSFDILKMLYESQFLFFKHLCYLHTATVSSSLRNASGTLVVCPASLVHHWKKEIDKRVKPLKITVCLYHGPTREKSADRYEINEGWLIT